MTYSDSPELSRGISSGGVGPLAVPYTGARAAGQRLLELWQERGGAYSWHPSAPCHGKTRGPANSATKSCLRSTSEWPASAGGIRTQKQQTSTDSPSPTPGRQVLVDAPIA